MSRRRESASLRASPTGRYCHGRWGNNCRYKPIMAGSVVSMGWPREGVTATIASNGEFARLSALIARQRRELDRMQSAAAARSVADLARGMLMERLGCSAAEAQEQLAHLSAESGTSVPELAAQVAGQALLAGQAPLAGEAGFGAREASRWRRIHPDMCSLAQRAARDDVEFWWPAGRPEGDSTPLMGRWPAGARVVLPMRSDRVTLGAMEICWPDPRAAFATPLRRQLTALAEVSAQALGTRLTDGDLAHDRAPWILGLLDGLLESAMFARRIGDDGHLVDFLICHLSDGFRDPAGRSAADLTGQSLLEAYPAAALPVVQAARE